FDVRTVEALPRLPSGKVDYRLLEAQVRRAVSAER
ncbi:MAG: hypothetical protein QOH66_595, partial [Actinomycetota bacterium]|nr:hypothetical protein [Actinomycetota bacterium]